MTRTYGRWEQFSDKELWLIRAGLKRMQAEGVDRMDLIANILDGPHGNGIGGIEEQLDHLTYQKVWYP